MLALSEISDMWELLVIQLPNHLPCHKMAAQKCIIFEQTKKKCILAHYQNKQCYVCLSISSILLQQEYSNNKKIYNSRSKINSISM